MVLTHMLLAAFMVSGLWFMVIGSWLAFVWVRLGLGLG